MSPIGLSLPGQSCRACAFKADSAGNLALVGQSSLNVQYQGDAYLFNQPYTCTAEPRLKGTYQINFSGTLAEEELTIKLSAKPAGLPGKVKVNCVDQKKVDFGSNTYVTQNTADLIGWATPSLAGFLIYKKGAKEFKLSEPLLWSMPLQNSGGVVVVDRVKGNREGEHPP